MSTSSRWLAAAMAAALTPLAAGGASAWVIDEEESLGATARAGAPIVYPAPSPARGPGVFVLHEAEGLCPSDAAASGDAVSCRTVPAADGGRRDRITIDMNRPLAMTGVVASELARATDAIDPRNGDRLASLPATTVLSSIPFQPPDTGGTEWTEVVFNIAGPVALRGAAPATDRTWALFKRFAKSMLLPAVAVLVTIVLLWVGLRRIRQAPA